jgi:hypothetical protein
LFFVVRSKDSKLRFVYTIDKMTFPKFDIILPAIGVKLVRAKGDFRTALPPAIAWAVSACRHEVEICEICGDTSDNIFPSICPLCQLAAHASCLDAITKQYASSMSAASTSSTASSLLVDLFNRQKSSHDHQSYGDRLHLSQMMSGVPASFLRSHHLDASYLEMSTPSSAEMALVALQSYSSICSVCLTLCRAFSQANDSDSS